jgi:hypothetical protein
VIKFSKGVNIMKQLIKTAEVKRKIEKLVDSANKDFNNGFTDLYDFKIYVSKVLFSYLEDLVCEPETWEDDMFRLNEWMDSLRH